jgi:hypothetical protein
MSNIIYTVKQDSMGADYIEGVIGDTVMIIPIDPANSDYQRYLRWLEDPETEENGTIS